MSKQFTLDQFFSFPVPDSPEMSTRPSVGATIEICFLSARIDTESPTISYSWPIFSERLDVSRSSSCWRMAFRTVSTVFSSESGFSMKSNAPSLVAFTAVSMFPWPEIIITASSCPRARSFSSVSRPSMPGSHMSSSMQPKRSDSVSSRHSSPVAAQTTLYPSSSSTSLRVERMPGSSSTTSTEFGPIPFNLSDSRMIAGDEEEILNAVGANSKPYESPF